MRMDNLEGVWVKPQVVTFSIIANEIFTPANPRILAGALLWGCGRFFVPSYAAQPSLRRYSSGLSHPSERLILPEQ